MDFYMTAGGTRLQLPMNPTKVDVQGPTHMESYNILLLGGVQLPRGTEVKQISWDATLPGEARKDMSFVKAWQAPNTIAAMLESWRTSGMKVRLLVTETTINLDVYITNFQPSWSGGFGDCDYHIDMVQARDLSIGTVSATGTVSLSTKSKRPTPANPTTYTVRPGDTLFAITKKYAKSATSSNINDLYNLNKNVIGPNKNLIKPGQVLRLPSNW